MCLYNNQLLCYIEPHDYSTTNCLYTHVTYKLASNTVWLDVTTK